MKDTRYLSCVFLVLSIAFECSKALGLHFNKIKSIDLNQCDQKPKYDKIIELKLLIRRIVICLQRK